MAGLIAQALLLAALAGTVGLGVAGWVVGVTCAVITNLALARGLVRYGCDRLGPADWVTLTRATLAVGVAALVADSFDRPAPVTLLVTLTVVALTLDAVDGWVVRRTGTATPLGAHFDGEVDAFLIASPQRVRRPLGRRVGARDRRGTLRVPRRRLAAAVDARAAAAALLAQGRRRDAGDRAGGRGCRRPAAGSDPGRPPRRTRPARRVVRPRRVVAVESTGTPRTVERRRSRTETSVAQSPLARRPRTRARASRSSPSLLTILALLVVWVALVAPDQLESSHARRVPAGSRSRASSSSPWPSCCPPPPDASWPASSGRCSVCWSS